MILSPRPARSARTVLLVAVASVLALLASCSGGGGDLHLAASPSSTTTTAAATGTTAAAPDCGNPLASYAPDPAAANGATVQGIKSRGRLRVAVSADTLLFGFFNPVTSQLEGFDIDISKQIAAAIFNGDQSKIEFRTVSYAQRIPALQNNDVDMVADVMTINCTRWAQINFSSEYYKAGQKVLVKKGSAAKSIDDLNGQRVCAAKGSTNIEEMTKYPKVKVVPVDDISDCMVLFQQGKTDSVTGDDTVLAGFVKQDPYAQVVGAAFTNEPYGLGIRKDQVDFVRFVNGVLAQIRTDGRYAQLFDKDVRQSAADQPPALDPLLYGRTP